MWAAIGLASSADTSPVPQWIPGGCGEGPVQLPGGPTGDRYGVDDVQIIVTLRISGSTAGCAADAQPFDEPDVVAKKFPLTTSHGEHCISPIDRRYRRVGVQLAHGGDVLADSRLGVEKTP